MATQKATAATTPNVAATLKAALKAFTTLTRDNAQKDKLIARLEAQAEKAANKASGTKVARAAKPVTKVSKVVKTEKVAKVVGKVAKAAPKGKVVSKAAKTAPKGKVVAGKPTKAAKKDDEFLI